MSNLADEIKKIKKASLYFDLITVDKEEETPALDTYFGGKPYVTDEKELHICPKCNVNMEFICQLLMPEKRTNVKKLYSFYYCFDCVKKNGEGTFAMNIYTNPQKEKMVEVKEYESVVPYCDVKFYPAYELPEFDFCEESNPEFINKLESLYGDRVFEAYEQLEDKVRDYINDTGFKIKGYPSFMEFKEIPRCPKTNELMEPLIQMENIPDLNMNWLDKDSYLILFKSPKYDEFALRTIDFDEYDDGLISDDVFEDVDEESELN